MLTFMASALDVRYLYHFSLLHESQPKPGTGGGIKGRESMQGQGPNPIWHGTPYRASGAPACMCDHTLQQYRIFEALFGPCWCGLWLGGLVDIFPVHRGGRSDYKPLTLWLICPVDIAVDCCAASLQLHSGFLEPGRRGEDVSFHTLRFVESELTRSCSNKQSLHVSVLSSKQARARASCYERQALVAKPLYEYLLRDEDNDLDIVEATFSEQSSSSSLKRPYPEWERCHGVAETLSRSARKLCQSAMN